MQPSEDLFVAVTVEQVLRVPGGGLMSGSGLGFRFGVGEGLVELIELEGRSLVSRVDGLLRRTGPGFDEALAEPERRVGC